MNLKTANISDLDALALLRPFSCPMAASAVASDFRPANLRPTEPMGTRQANVKAKYKSSCNRRTVTTATVTTNSFQTLCEPHCEISNNLLNS